MLTEKKHCAALLMIQQYSLVIWYSMRILTSQTATGAGMNRLALTLSARISVC